MPLMVHPFQYQNEQMPMATKSSKLIPSKGHIMKGPNVEINLDEESDSELTSSSEDGGSNSNDMDDRDYRPVQPEEPPEEFKMTKSNSDDDDDDDDHGHDPGRNQGNDDEDGDTTMKAPENSPKRTKQSINEDGDANMEAPGDSSERMDHINEFSHSTALVQESNDDIKPPPRESQEVEFFSDLTNSNVTMKMRVVSPCRPSLHTAPVRQAWNWSHHRPSRFHLLLSHSRAMESMSTTPTRWVNLGGSAKP